MSELRAICAGAQEMVEAGMTYVHLPELRLPCAPAVLDGLLCLQQHAGYTTRLFLSAQMPGKGNNWTSHQILGKHWYTWSWNNVPADLRPAEVLLGHLSAFR